MIGNTNDDMIYLLNETGQEILVNETDTVKAFIKSLKQDDFDDKEIRTNHPIKRGDMILFQGIKYLIITESVTKKPLLYKAVMRNFNANITIEVQDSNPTLIGRDSKGRPIYDYLMITIHLPLIIEHQSFTIDSTGGLLIADNTIIVTTNDTPDNRTRFALNQNFQAINKNWKVRNQDVSKNGLLVLTCEFTTV